MVSEQPIGHRAQLSAGDDPDTAAQEWARSEALMAKTSIPRSYLADASVSRQGSMTLDASSAGGRPHDLAVDAALRDRLVAQGCAGREWETFVAGMYQKATRVAYRWLVEGRIFAAAAKIGRPIAQGDIAEWASDDVRALAHEVVEEAFKLFRTQLLSGGYDASCGATLFTYFMNSVIRQFPNVFRRTSNARRSWTTQVDLHGDPNEYDQPDHDDYYAAHVRYTTLLFSLIRGINAPQQRQAAWLSFAEGLSNEQIARQLEITTDATRALVNRARIAMQTIYLQQQVEEGGRR